MEFNVKSGYPEKQRTECIVAAVFESRRLSSTAERLDKASGGYISNILRKGDLDGKFRQILLLYNVPNILSERVLLIGCGLEKKFDNNKFRGIVNKIVNALNNIGVMEAVCFITECKVIGRDLYWKIQQAVLSSHEASYNFDTYKSNKNLNRFTIRRIIFTVETRRDLNVAEDALIQGIGLAKGIKYAKDLGNTPANICNPTYLANEASTLAKKYSNININILEKKDMQALGMGALLSVTQGSNQPPKLITLETNGVDIDNSPVVLVGKGITFDTGGNSMKSPEHMVGMKYDMCGAAAVLGVFLFICEMKLPIKLVGIIAAAENIPGGNASRPDDVITSLSGTTIEIINTDAEGRLVLCDALSYSEKFKPEVVIDIATLTGACVVALGRHYTGLYSNNSLLAHELVLAGNCIDDKCWQMPLSVEYQKELNSNFADVSNVGGSEAGSITAACFLSKFAKKYNWAHLDIAGTACRYSGRDKSATGRPVSLIAQFLINRYQNLI